MLNQSARAAATGAAALLPLLLTGCLVEGSGSAVSRGTLSGDILGSGATFPDPLFQQWMSYYNTSIETGTSIDYQAIGSGEGIEQFLAQEVDFGSSERYLQASELLVAREVRGCEAVQFPVVFGAVVIALNDPALDGLILDSEVIAGIYDRRVTRYDDPAIAELNPDLDLPGREIVPVHRSDGSGTTYVFTSYLANEVGFWAEEYAGGTDIDWHDDTVGGDGNDGVAQAVGASPGGLGYVNQSYALRNGLATARVVNEDGTPIEPTLAATTAASEEAEIPDDFQFSIDDIGGDGYPITGANWVLAYECGYNNDTADVLRDFWAWALTDAEADRFASDLGYAPMGRGLKERVLTEIQRINSS
ncbi:phosphate ABC transporter substrate-binding protein PstS [Streptomyces sp. NBC_01803]|uniref:phosphate ABC transporter substrate-binding protein PstS n=1 Tax=Streptomyces sp. NBC_01803 TaxID=2975946 RepID=UPI002DDB530B|nr:phosphate ABC transporter substrate-binding protein PstS [Streptomyces sp. NBC_01803]WSA42993.1 phosphate ABC transporter substrate-binding protein PstS [Streptomyces sp. NBC_01803]